jgi:kinesin family protein C1
MIRRDEDDDDEEERGVQPFLISTNPGESFKAPRKRPIPITVLPQRTFHLSAARAVSSPTFRPITPVQEEPANTDCEEFCANLEALTLSVFDAETRHVGIGRGMPSSDEDANIFLKPLPFSRLPQATPTRQPPVQTPTRPSFSTPRNTRKRYLNRFTNDYCPDFYDDRMEAMERQFSAFKEKMETDMQKATDQKESIQQLQSRGTFPIQTAYLSHLWC